MRLLVAALVFLLTLAASGCNGTHDTELGVTVTNAFGGGRYRVTCAPPGGSVPHPAALCNLLAANADTMLSETEPHRECVGGLGTIHLHVKGRFNGEAVDDEVSACAGNLEGERLWLIELPAPPRAGGYSAPVLPPNITS